MEEGDHLLYQMVHHLDGATYVAIRHLAEEFFLLRLNEIPLALMLMESQGTIEGAAHAVN